MVEFSWPFILALFAVTVLGSAEPFTETLSFPHLQLHQPHLGFLRKLSMDAEPQGRPNKATTLQSGSSLCIWKDGECMVNVGGNAMDDDIMVLFKRGEKCLKKRKFSNCDRKTLCVWNSVLNLCAADNYDKVKQCIEPEYATWARTGYCTSTHQREKCMDEPACLWNAFLQTCEANSFTQSQAGMASTRLSNALDNNIQCLISTLSCASPCINIGGNCIYEPLVDASQWFLPTATSTLCQTIKLSALCEHRDYSGEKCDGICKTAPEGYCTVTDEAFIDVLFPSSSEEKTHLLDGLKLCPINDNPEDCNSFNGRR